MLTIKCFNHLHSSDDHDICRIFEASTVYRCADLGYVQFQSADGLTVCEVNPLSADEGNVQVLRDVFYGGFDKIVIENGNGKTVDVLRRPGRFN